MSAPVVVCTPVEADSGAAAVAGTSPVTCPEPQNEEIASLPAKICQTYEAMDCIEWIPRTVNLNCIC